VIRLIADNVIPVAVNLYVIREDKTAAGDFYSKLNQQLPEYQGLYLASPEGKILAKKSVWPKGGRKNWAESVAATLQEGLDAFGPVKPRQGSSDYLARRGCGLDREGGAILAVSTKLLFVLPLPEDLADLNPSAIPATGHDAIVLSASDLKNLVPDKVAAGTAWTAPEEVAQKFFPVLDNWDKRFRKPSELTAVKLSGKVRSIRHDIAYLNFEGRLAGTHIWGKESGPRLAGKSLASEVQVLSGVGAYDLATGEQLSLTLVFQGRAGDPAKLREPGKEGAYGAVVEWRRYKTAN